MQDKSENFGSYLKHERELRGVTLEEIATATKIHVRYLQCLESNEYDQLPGEVFIRGFIRSYGIALGADVEDLVSAYDESIGRERKEKMDRTFSEMEAESERKKTMKKHSLILAMAVLVVSGGMYLVFFGNPLGSSVSQEARQVEETALTVPVQVEEEVSDTESTSVSTETDESGATQEKPSQPSGTSDTKKKKASKAEISPVKEASAKKKEKTKPPAEKKPAQSKTEKPKEIKKAEPVKEKIVESKVPANEEKDKPAEPVDAKSKTENPVTENSVPVLEVKKDDAVVTASVESINDVVDLKPIRLVINVSENSWFNLTVDKDNALDFILPAGTSKTIHADDAIRVTIGNRRGTKLILNERELDLPNSPDNVIRNFLVSEDTLG